MGMRLRSPREGLGVAFDEEAEADAEQDGPPPPTTWMAQPMASETRGAVRVGDRCAHQSQRSRNMELFGWHLSGNWLELRGVSRGTPRTAASARCSGGACARRGCPRACAGTARSGLPA